MASSSNEKPVCLMQKTYCRILPMLLFRCSSNQMVSSKSSNDLIKCASSKLLFSSAWYILCLGAFLYKLVGNVERPFENVFCMKCWNWLQFQIWLHYFSTFCKFIPKSVLCALWNFWLVSSQIHWQSLIHSVIKSDLLKVKENPCIFYVSYCILNSSHNQQIC